MNVCKKVIALLVLSAGVAAGAQAGGHAASEYREVRGKQTGLVDQVKRYSAWSVAAMLADPQFAPALARHVGTDGKPVMMNALLADYGKTGASAKAGAATLRLHDKRVREHKSIAADAKSLLELRLYTPKGYAGKVNWENLLVAYTPAGKRKEWTEVEAFDRNGQAHYLDARSAPSQPVLIAGINRREDVRAGLAYMNRSLREAGMQSVAPRSALALTSGIETTRLDRIRVGTDEEPWISGAAEMYAVVSGVQPDQAKAQLTVVDLPYLDWAGTTYSPNQIVIFWSEYRYAAANLQLFEHDDNTNYKDLVLALTQGVSTILGVFAPEYAVIAQVANAIIQAMPGSWFSNDDDYVDSYYTLEKGRSYQDYQGAGGNATVSLSPYLLQQQ